MTPLRLLFAEDNEDIREIVKLFLQTILPADSYTLTLVEDGGAALTHLRAHPTDVSFLDLSMPVLDGWTLAATIKADPALAKTILIAVTAHVMEKDRKRAVEVGFDDFLKKPIYPETLQEVLERHVGSRGQGAA